MPGRNAKRTLPAGFLLQTVPPSAVAHPIVSIAGVATLLAPAVSEEVERSADPAAAGPALARILEARPDLTDRLASDGGLVAAAVAVAAASPYLTRLCIADPAAVDVLADLGARPVLAEPIGDAVALARWKRLELLRVAARDLLGLERLEETGVALSALADDVLTGSARLAAGPRAAGELAVIGMGKLGGQELNYASDIDVIFVGDSDPRPLLAVARNAWRVDVDLRPEGRNGPLTRSLESYLAYWDRWADTWEFQALIKARPVAGDRALSAAFMAAAQERVWGRPFGAEELRAVRAMKARAEGQVARRGQSDRELKLGPGGIRDIEFAVQLLQLVHGRADPALRSPTTLSALAELALAGYVATADAEALDAAYRFLRAAEHRLQLVENQQVHALPSDTAARTRLARVMGFRDSPDETALGHFERELRRHQATVRSIHERLFFRPLLEVFTRAGSTRPAGLTERAVAERLAAFGFSDADRTRHAVEELTRGFSRSSRLMQQLLPLLFEWLSQAPDPDLGLLGLRSLSTGQHRRDHLLALFRESPEAARRLCLLLGTSAQFNRGFERHPDLLADLDDDRVMTARKRGELQSQAQKSLGWRRDEEERRHALDQLRQVEWLRVPAADVLGLADVTATERGLTALAEAVLQTALDEVAPSVPFAIVAMGRLGGAELTYASDLDVLLVFEGDDPAQVSAAEAAAEQLLRYLNGDTPANRLWTLDTALRPEGRQGPLARSVAAYQTYYSRWAQLWERQALLRGRFVAGDPDVGRKFHEVADAFVWDAPLTKEQVREIRRMKARIEHERIPAGEDPQFHLKLGRGSLSDVEWTAQLLQWQHGIRVEGTMAALAALSHAGVIPESDANVLADAYRFCEETRNRLYLVRGGPGDALPGTGPLLTRLARSLGTTPAGLREEYRRRTRRSRQVMERLFYGRAGPS
jgi:[glutamine synthetase] adenylyltransferase / [glutamine synthetase]-adenylyl-L-tyrosine phosphorylase